MIEKLKKNINTIRENYFVAEKSKLYIGDKTSSKIEGWNLAALGLAYAMRKNVLLLGEPGFGKTTASAIIGCAMTGFPMDLYRSVLISGHPDQSEEKMIARPDFGKLLDKKEQVIWQKALYFSLVQLDEFNRLSSGKQSEFLDAIANQGRFGYLNESFFSGPKSFFATVNYQDEGNNQITPPALDRFHVCQVFGFPGAIYDDFVYAFSNNAKEKLCDRDYTGAVLDVIQDKSMPVEAKLEKISKLQKSKGPKLLEEAGLEVITEKDFEELREKITAVELDEDAKLFLRCLQAELNTTGIYGDKRSCDPVDESNHGKALASHNVENACGPRCYNESIRDFAKAVALYCGADKVSKAHIEAVAPYCMAHRLRFTDDYKAKFTDKPRDSTFDVKLGEELVREVSGRFGDSSKGIRNTVFALNTYITTATRDGKDPSKEKSLKEHLKRIKEMCAEPKKVDHPLLKEMVDFINEVCPPK
ncbi:hypothetical protein KY330_04755 [Candidatus Woesearchaeota archaeon]|nr:hypothetical protein [Candidatus Woesearchaeota archaeon]